MKMVYGSGKIMSHDGPFNQSSSNKWKLCKYIKENGIEYLLGRCKFLHAVWFPSVVKEKFQDSLVTTYDVDEKYLNDLL